MRLCFLLLAGLLIPAFGFTAPLPEISIPIKKIIIQGNEKTREEVILGIIRTKEGEPYTQETVPKIQRYLDNQRKFKYVKVWSEIEKDGARIFIEVKDKWSIVPVPYYSNQGETDAYGFAFLESNFLGYQNILLFSITHEYDTWDGTFLFSHPRVLGSLFSYTVIANKLTQKIYDFDGDTKLSSFFKEEKGGDLNLKYQFYGEHYLMFHFFHSNFEIESPLENKKGNSDYFQLYLELDWTHYEGVIGHGTWLGLFWEKDFTGEVQRNQTGFKLEQYFSPGKDQNIYLLMNYFYSFQISHYFEERIGANATAYNTPLRGYETAQIPAKHSFSSSIEYRVSVTEIYSVNVSVVPFMDAVLSSPDQKRFPDRLDYSSGVGLRFYFNSVLVPAAQVFFGYAWKYGDYAIGVTIGTRF